MRKKQIKIPAAQFGLEQIGNITQQLPQAATLFTAPFQTSTATSGKEAAAQSVTNILSGAGTGASIGMGIGGPVGAAIGAIGGAAVGLIGKKGESAEMTSFTDYDEGTLGTGLIGAFNNKKLRRERTRIKNNAWNNRAAVAGTQNLRADYYTNNAEDSIVSLANGGSVSSLVYADDGELINTPDGNITKLPEKGKPTDSNLLNLPNGSKILSDSLKVPGTNKTFAKMGEEMMKIKKSKGKDKYAENTNKLNEINNNIIYNNLFNQQEQLKAEKGIKKKTKRLVPKAKNGIYVMDPNKYNTDINAITITPEKQQELNNLYKIGEKNRIANKRQQQREQRQKTWNNISDGLSSMATGLSTLAPIVSNLFTSNEKPVDATYNPYANTSLNVYSRRRYNPSPTINAINRQRAISNYNANQSNTGTGSSMAYRLASLIGTQQNIADVYAQANNINNQYLGEYASALDNQGRQWVDATNRAYDINSANRATTRNIRRTGLSQLSQYAQNRELMRNQQTYDRAMLQLYEPFMQAGFTKADWNRFKGYINRIGG